MIKPIDGDVSGAVALVAQGTAEVSKDCSAVMPGVAPLELQAIAEKGVAARCVDDEARLEGLLTAVFMFRLDAGSARGG